MRTHTAAAMWAAQEPDRMSPDGGKKRNGGGKTFDSNRIRVKLKFSRQRKFSLLFCTFEHFLRMLFSRALSYLKRYQANSITFLLPLTLRLSSWCPITMSR